MQSNSKEIVHIFVHKVYLFISFKKNTMSVMCSRVIFRHIWWSRDATLPGISARHVRTVSDTVEAWVPHIGLHG